ncbi:hypothetical protein SGLAM104S_04109 [Streptomyces glaucescens]
MSGAATRRSARLVPGEPLASQVVQDGVDRPLHGERVADLGRGVRAQPGEVLAGRAGDDPEPSAAFSMRTTYSPPRTGTPRCLCRSRTVSCPPSATVPADSRSRRAFRDPVRVALCGEVRAGRARGVIRRRSPRMPSTRAGVCVRCPGTTSPGLGGGAASAAVAAAGTTGTTSAATPISAAAPDMPFVLRATPPVSPNSLWTDSQSPQFPKVERRRPPPGGAMKPTTRRVINGAGVSTDQFRPPGGDGNLRSECAPRTCPKGPRAMGAGLLPVRPGGFGGIFRTSPSSWGCSGRPEATEGGTTLRAGRAGCR